MTQNFSIDDQLKKAKNFVNKGNYLEAKECYQKILKLFPKNTRALEGINKLSKYSDSSDGEYKNSINKLINLYNTAQYSKSLEYGNKLLTKYSRHVMIINILGATYAALNKYTDSIKLYQLALEIEPKNIQVLNNLGITYKNVNNYKKAKISFEKAISLKPNFVEAYNNLALTLKEEKKLEDAIKLLKKAVSINPNYFEGFYNMGNILTSLGQFKMAIENYEKVIKIKPNHFGAYNNKGATYNISKEYQKAYQSIKKAIEINPNVADAFNNLGTAELNLENERDAINSYNKAIKIDPKLVIGYSNLCSLYEKSNNIEMIQKTLNLAKKENLQNYDEIKFRSGQLASRKSEYKVSISFLESIDDDKISNKMKIDKYALLGKDYDKTQKYRKAFLNFQKANSLTKLSLEYKLYNPKKYQNEISELIESYSKHKIINWKNNHLEGEINPVFLIGFPRSGTTLLDNILSSHSKIITLEEKPMVAKMKKYLNKIATYENLYELSDNELSKLQNIYFKELKKHIDLRESRGKVFIDKLPLNIIDLGLILRVFPKAKFILSIRDPNDCVLSCFMQTFNLNDAMANFLDLKDSANLYDLSMRLFEIYNNIFNLDCHLIKYEDLVVSLKEETSKLLASLNLDWNDEIFNYQNVALSRKINTPSYNQVIEKLYTRALGRWKNYKTEMKDVLPILEFWTKKWQY